MARNDEGDDTLKEATHVSVQAQVTGGLGLDRGPGRQLVIGEELEASSGGGNPGK